MSIVIDTSVWVDHFRNHNDALVNLMTADRVLIHPLVIGEIACGTPPAPRERTLQSLQMLQPCRQASIGEVMAFIEAEKLFGQGCGLIDLSLLASTLITSGALLWTLDRRLADMAIRFGVGYTPLSH